MLTSEKLLTILDEEGCEIKYNSSDQLEDIVESINYHFNLEEKIDSLIDRAMNHIKDISNSNVDMYLKEKQINHWISYISALEVVNAFTQGPY